jgi:hypothetical protein
MRGRIRVGELIQREGLTGEVVNLCHSWHTGIIHGDDGYDVSFGDDSLALGFPYRKIAVGLRVSYGIYFAAGARVPTAINLKPVSADQATDLEKSPVIASVRAGGSEAA